MENYKFKKGRIYVRTENATRGYSHHGAEKGDIVKNLMDSNYFCNYKNKYSNGNFRPATPTEEEAYKQGTTNTKDIPVHLKEKIIELW